MKIFMLFTLALSFVAPAYAAGTKIVEVSADKSGYFANDVAVLRAHLVSTPSNPNMEFDLTGQLNSVDFAITKVTDHEFYSETDPLAAGAYNWKIRVWLQDARLARDLKTSIQVFSDRIVAIDLALQTETNPQTIADLQAERSEKADLLAACQAQLASIRTQVAAANLNFTVN